MLYQSDDLMLAHANQRRQQLQDEAHGQRLARQARTALLHNRAQPSPSRRIDHLLHAAGVLLVHWGTRLQQRGEMKSKTVVDTRPA
jgi:hypothetical protein